MSPQATAFQVSQFASSPMGGSQGEPWRPQGSRAAAPRLALLSFASREGSAGITLRKTKNPTTKKHMKTTIKTLIVIGSLVCAAGAAKAADAAENWSGKCASCHAKDGTGATTMGKKYGVKDYTDAKVQAEITDEAAMKAIMEGVNGDDGKVKMKSFKEKVTEAEAKDLIAYIRAFKK